MRGALETMMRGMGMDHLVPDSWYSLIGKEVLKTNKVHLLTPSYSSLYIMFTFFTKDVRSVMQKYNGSLIKAVEDLFPEINLDKKKFAFGPSKIIASFFLFLLDFSSLLLSKCYVFLFTFERILTYH